MAAWSVSYKPSAERDWRTVVVVTHADADPTAAIAVLREQRDVQFIDGVRLVSGDAVVEQAPGLTITGVVPPGFDRIESPNQCGRVTCGPVRTLD